MRTTLLILMLFLLPQVSMGADWKRLQDRKHSFMEIDMHSISGYGALKQATIREVFSVPDDLSSGKKYDVRNMHLKINCIEESSAIQAVGYFYKGVLMHTLTVPPDRLEFLAMEGRGIFSRTVCGTK